MIAQVKQLVVGDVSIDLFQGSIEVEQMRRVRIRLIPA